MKVGCAHYDGHFTDIYDLLENNALTAAAKLRPRFSLK